MERSLSSFFQFPARKDTKKVCSTPCTSLFSIPSAYDQRRILKRKLKRKDPFNKCKLPCPKTGEKQEKIYEEGTGLSFCGNALQLVHCFSKKVCFLNGKEFFFSNLSSVQSSSGKCLHFQIFLSPPFSPSSFFSLPSMNHLHYFGFFRLPEIFSYEFSVLFGLLFMCRDKKETLLRIKSQTQ